MAEDQGSGDDKDKDQNKDTNKDNKTTNSDTNSGGDNDAQLRSQEAANYRVQLRQREAELKELTPQFEELKKFKEEFDAQNKSEIDKLNDNQSKLQSQLDEVKNSNKQLLQENNFLKSPESGKFVNANAAMKFLSDYNPQFDDTGKITNMKEILASIEKDHPYLINKDAGGSEEIDENKDGKDGENSDASGNASGTPFNGKKTDAQVDRAALEAKYPALRGR